jgi:hypothetical protein
MEPPIKDAVGDCDKHGIKESRDDFELNWLNATSLAYYSRQLFANHILENKEPFVENKALTVVLQYMER